METSTQETKPPMAGADEFGGDLYYSGNQLTTEGDNNQADISVDQQMNAQLAAMEGVESTDANADPGEKVPDQEDEYEDDDEDEGVQIVLDTETVDKGNPNASFTRRSIRPGQSPAAPQKIGFQKPNQGGQGGASASDGPFTLQSIPTGQSAKNSIEIDIDQLEEKPWRKPGADITDYFNYGFNEDTWKSYAQKQVQLRLEQSMQTKIKVYSSEGGNNTSGSTQSAAPAGLGNAVSVHTSKQEMPPELLAMLGGNRESAPSGPPSTSSYNPAMRQKRGPSDYNDWPRQDHNRGRGPRQQDDTVIQVLGGNDDNEYGVPLGQSTPTHGEYAVNTSDSYPARSYDRDGSSRGSGQRDYEEDDRRRDDRDRHSRSSRDYRDDRDYKREGRSSSSSSSRDKREDEERKRKRS